MEYWQHIGISTTQPLHLMLEEHQKRAGGKTARVRTAGYMPGDSNLRQNREAAPMKSKLYGYLT